MVTDSIQVFFISFKYSVFLPQFFFCPRETIMLEIYSSQIDEMHYQLKCECPAVTNRKRPIFYTIILVPTSTTDCKNSMNLSYKTVFHLPYSIDHSSTDFFSISKSNCCEKFIQVFCRLQDRRILCTRKKSTCMPANVNIFTQFYFG